MRIELDVFSGLPNPAWQILGADEERVLRAISNLMGSEVSAYVLEPDGLGFRGWILSEPRGRPFDTATVTPEGVVVRRRGGAVQFADRDRTVHCLIASTLSGRLNTELRRLLP